ncbi:hypothetical protein JXQ70_02595 [bacterium]|nr:hypothetical protein [bacterium]
MGVRLRSLKAIIDIEPDHPKLLEYYSEILTRTAELKSEFEEQFYFLVCSSLKKLGNIQLGSINAELVLIESFRAKKKSGLLKRLGKQKDEECPIGIKLLIIETLADIGEAASEYLLKELVLHENDQILVEASRNALQTIDRRLHHGLESPSAHTDHPSFSGLTERTETPPDQTQPEQLLPTHPEIKVGETIDITAAETIDFSSKSADEVDPMDFDLREYLLEESPPTIKTVESESDDKGELLEVVEDYDEIIVELPPEEHISEQPDSKKEERNKKENHDTFDRNTHDIVITDDEPDDEFEIEIVIDESDEQDSDLESEDQIESIALEEQTDDDSEAVVEIDDDSDIIDPIIHQADTGTEPSMNEKEGFGQVQLEDHDLDREITFDVENGPKPSIQSKSTPVPHSPVLSQTETDSDLASGDQVIEELMEELELEDNQPVFSTPRSKHKKPGKSSKSNTPTGMDNLEQVIDELKSDLHAEQKKKHTLKSKKITSEQIKSKPKLEIPKPSSVETPSKKEVEERNSTDSLETVDFVIEPTHSAQEKEPVHTSIQFDEGDEEIFFETDEQAQDLSNDNGPDFEPGEVQDGDHPDQPELPDVEHMTAIKEETHDLDDVFLHEQDASDKKSNLVIDSDLQPKLTVEFHEGAEIHQDDLDDMFLQEISPDKNGPKGTLDQMTSETNGSSAQDTLPHSETTIELNQVPSLADTITNIMELNVSIDEGYILSLIDGHTSVIDIARISGLDKKETIQYLGSLVSKRIIRFQ